MSAKCGKDSDIIQVVVSKDLRKFIEQEAKKEGRSMSNFARYALERLMTEKAAKAS